jgi:RNA polymerase sigma factor (sigma-70 family)
MTVDELVAETRWLHRVAFALVKDEAAADDLTQDTFVVAATEAPNDGRPLRPWLHRVLWNRIKMRTRTNQRRRSREERFGALAQAPVQPDEIVDRIELHRMLAALVLALPVTQRDVVLLRFFEGLSSSQIGNRLGISPNTVRWRLKSAIDELRAKLEQREPNRAWVASLMPLARRSTPVASSHLLWVGAAALLLLAIASVVLYVVANQPSPRPTLAAKHLERAAGQQAAAGGAGARAASSASEPTRADGTLGGDHRRLTGTVVDKAGALVEGAEVSLDCGYRGGKPMPNVRSGRDGEFAFDVDRECNFMLAATKGSARGSANRWLSVPGAPPKIQIRPSTHGIVRVLDDATGAPIANATVFTEEMFGGGESSAVTGGDGIARLEIAVPVFIRVTASDYVQARKPFDPRTGHEPPYFIDDHAENRVEAQLDIRLSRGVFVAGAILDPSGNPVPAALVRVAGPMTEEFPPQQSITADAGGHFELTVPRPGRYKLWAETEDLTVDGPQRFDVPTDGQPNVIAHLVARPELRGTVVDSVGKAVAGAHVSTHDGQTRPVITDAKGRFAIKISDDSPFDVIARLGVESSEFQHLQVAYGNQAEATLQLGASGIAGTAVERDGTPVPGAIIWLNGCCEDGNPSVVRTGSAVADAQGKFTFDVPRGNFVLSVKRTPDDDYEDEDDVKVAGGSRNVKVVVP